MDETQLPQGSINKNAGNNISIQNAIQNPQNFYVWDYTKWPTNFGYFNLWSAQNTTTGWNDNAVVKTVYDPCPVGFKIPASNAFTGFTSNGQYQSTAANINAKETNKSQENFSAAYGHNFYTNSSKTATIFFPATGGRDYKDGSVGGVGSNGSYWSAVPFAREAGCFLNLDWNRVGPQEYLARSSGFAARPVSE